MCGSCSGFLAYRRLHDLNVVRCVVIQVCIFAQVCENDCVTTKERKWKNHIRHKNSSYILNL